MCELMVSRVPKSAHFLLPFTHQPPSCIKGLQPQWPQPRRCWGFRFAGDWGTLLRGMGYFFKQNTDFTRTTRCKHNSTESQKDSVSAVSAVLFMWHFCWILQMMNLLQSLRKLDPIIESISNTEIWWPPNRDPFYRFLKNSQNVEIGDSLPSPPPQTR